MNENIKAIKILVNEIQNELTAEQYKSYQLIIEALEELERLEKEKC